ncbi:transposable element Tcb1 transposase [Trichonephila clavipes]|uniref:Transposable element Tcb1 transposase n=1 Tax=Trichonephila clavipes TaxID=2585209 RepID=A0A8X6RMF8_TRICX|nr:transposable element Tcb1 transposase [Trichonephila clavipes]
MQEGTTDRRGRSHPPKCTTSLSARTIRRRLQQSGLPARRSLLDLNLTQNHRRLRRQWFDERRMWMAEGNEVVFTDESRICLQHHDGRIRVWRHCGERMLTAALCTATFVLHRVLWYGISLLHSFSTHCRYFKQPALHLRGVGASCASLPSWFDHIHNLTG